MNKRLISTASKTGEHVGENAAGAIPARSLRSPLCRVEALHHTVGNQAVQQLFVTGALSPALAGSKDVPVVQRKIEANTLVMKNNSLDNYLRSKGITAYNKSGGVYSRGWTSTSSLEKQILYDMLASDREFSVAGTLPITARQNLDRHVKARVGVVDYTKKGTYSWGVNTSVKMNPRYWRKVGGRLAPQRGVTMVEAAQDVFTNPSRFSYAMACHAAAGVTMVAGSGSDQIKEPGGIKEHDWVPGDWGYLENTGYKPGKSMMGHEGQNMIYLSDGKYWGHPSGVKTIPGWKSHIRIWDKADAKLQDWRRYPAVGLD